MITLAVMMRRTPLTVFEMVMFAKACGLNLELLSNWGTETMNPYMNVSKGHLALSLQMLTR